MKQSLSALQISTPETSAPYFALVLQVEFFLESRRAAQNNPKRNKSVLNPSLLCGQVRDSYWQTMEDWYKKRRYDHIWTRIDRWRLCAIFIVATSADRLILGNSSKWHHRSVSVTFSAANRRRSSWQTHLADPVGRPARRPSSQT